MHKDSGNLVEVGTGISEALEADIGIAEAPEVDFGIVEARLDLKIEHNYIVGQNLCMVWCDLLYIHMNVDVSDLSD